MNQEAKPIIVEQTFNSPIQVVWDALTKEEQMKQWFQTFHHLNQRSAFKQNLAWNRATANLPICGKFLK